MNELTYIATTNYHKNLLFGIKIKDRAGQIYCLGKTGSGKSTLLLNMAISDINAGNGLGIIDPHGDLSEEILNYIPSSRIKDVIYFNASDNEHPVSYNPLSDADPEHFHIITSSIVGTFKKVWSESWGPRLEHILRNTVLTLLYCP